MTLIEKIRVIERVDNMIRLKATGSPEQLARKLNVSLRTVFNLIKLMRKMGAPIAFSYHSNSYYYEHEVVFITGFKRSTK